MGHEKNVWIDDILMKQMRHETWDKSIIYDILIWHMRHELKTKRYIITEWFFYINHFSLIIFYHSVWLGFELFGS